MVYYSESILSSALLCMLEFTRSSWPSRWLIDSLLLEWLISLKFWFGSILLCEHKTSSSSFLSTWAVALNYSLVFVSSRRCVPMGLIEVLALTASSTSVAVFLSTSWMSSLPVANLSLKWEGSTYYDVWMSRNLSYKFSYYFLNLCSPGPGLL